MNRSQSYLTAFNTQVINIATELHQMYPDDKMFKFVVTAAKLIKSANPRLLYRNVITPMIEYRQQVFNEDENFFQTVINEHVEQKTKENRIILNKTEEEKAEERRKRMEEENKTEEELEKEAKQREENFNLVLRIRVYWEGMSENTKKKYGNV